MHWGFGLRSHPKIKRGKLAGGVATTEFLHEQDVPHSLLNSVSSQRSLIQQFLDFLFRRVTEAVHGRDRIR
ncbi:MAG: hypothetical protein KME25_08975 [Symplocastrum torsivum CPER-KK1]|uniref:Uncharacterized protein n=1 Tax=Symplocastrum torsivum CPER-KK1 TaxID=450513 RepID=A0A951PKF1_9CYAN|nr:hypothetical protein [Symplocastrum torsivum CPER-KK1]